MSHESIKAAFSNAVNHVASNISLYVINPITDFTRNRKIGAANLISFMVSWGLPAPNWNFLISLVWFQMLLPLLLLISSGQN